MKYMSAQEIRMLWLNFFKEKGHEILPSASLIPVDDPTLLWVNAGVAPLKKYFDGSMKPNSPRIVNVQKSIRTNDIDHVGKTARHHTFFEMLGNFSIGDYFKKEALSFAYELLFAEKWFGFPKEKIYITYYPNDFETKDLWLSLGVHPDHLIPLEGNYWEIGKGPAGPDTEIFFDRGEVFDNRGIELLYNDIENDRYIEIWNIVFSQYNADPTLDRSMYPELPSKNIDTGAGLERIACILQNTQTNFETDLHYPIILKTEQLSGITYEGQMAYKVISDHLKTLVFAISDGAMISNEGRGYVLRRLLRRAVKSGRSLGFNAPFLYQLVDTVVEMMQAFYPTLQQTKSIVQKIIQKEEVKFFDTIAEGEKHLLESIKQHQITGQDAFKLYDTYGFPIELTLEYAEEQGGSVDLEDFKAHLEAQKARSRNARHTTHSMASQEEAYLNFETPSKFVGYDVLQVEAKVIKVFKEGIVLDQTPFYAKAGGQVADTGTINGLRVKDVIKMPHQQPLHIIETNSFQEGDEVLAIVDEKSRQLTNRNHTVTHLLHQSIKDTLGKHAHQQGSYNGPEKLTFDINHYEAINTEDILTIEAIVKTKIQAGIEVKTHLLPIEEAKKLGAMMLFGEKYGKLVRVVDIDGWSLEFCGGTHVKNTKDIQDFMIYSVESIGSGIYRFEGLTSDIKSFQTMYLKNYLETLQPLIEKKKTLTGKAYQLPDVIGSYQDIINYRHAIQSLSEEVKQLEKEKMQQEISLILTNADQFIPSEIKEQTLIVVKHLPNGVLKPLIDVLYDKIKTEAIILINQLDEKANFLIKTKSLDAKTLMQELILETDGNGGGKKDFAQGGTSNLVALENYLRKINL